MTYAIVRAPVPVTVMPALADLPRAYAIELRANEHTIIDETGGELDEGDMLAKVILEAANQIVPAPSVAA